MSGDKAQDSAKADRHIKIPQNWKSIAKSLRSQLLQVTDENESLKAENQASLDLNHLNQEFNDNE